MAEIISMPKLGFDMAEGTLVRWVKAEGEAVKKGDVLAEIETDKATVEVESSFEGLVHQHLVEQGSIVPVGTPIAVIAAPGEKVENLPAAAGSAPAAQPAVAPAVDSAPAAPAPVLATEPVVTGPVKASPIAKRIASELGVNLAQVRGSGPGGRVIRRDVEEAAAQLAAAPAAATAPAKAETLAAPLPLVLGEAPADVHIPVDRLRAAIGRRMVESKQQVPHFYLTYDYAVDGLMALRKQINDLLPDEQKLSVNDFVVKAVALALRQFPGLNASLRGNEIIRHGHVNVGVAVALESGLLTVVCRDTDLKPLRVISNEMKEMVARARLGKVKTEDIEGSTFSISNLGMFDVEHFAAIINPPEAAILAVGSARQVAAVVDGEVHARLCMRATLSADHRVSDGAEAAQYMQALAVYLEQPLRMML